MYDKGIPLAAFAFKTVRQTVLQMRMHCEVGVKFFIFFYMTFQEISCCSVPKNFELRVQFSTLLVYALFLAYWSFGKSVVICNVCILYRELNTVEMRSYLFYLNVRPTYSTFFLQIHSTLILNFHCSGFIWEV